MAPGTKPAGIRQFPVLGGLLLLLLLLVADGTLQEQQTGHQRIHLRTGTIVVPHAPARSVERRRMAEEEDGGSLHRALGDRWGPTVDGQQVLVALRTPVPPGAMEAVIDVVEAAGGHVDNLIPEATLLVVCRPSTADSLAELPQVSWVGDLLPEHKLSPDWDPVLDAIHSALGSRKGGGDPLADAALLLHGNGTEATRPGQGLHVDPQGRVPVVVSFPLLSPAGSALRHSSEKRQQRRQQEPSNATAAGGGGFGADEAADEALTEPWIPPSEPSSYDPAAAAAAEWPTELSGLLGAARGALEVEAAGRHRAVVWVPLRHLPGVLGFAASHPGVQWVAPRFRHHYKNYYASAIISQGLKPRAVAGERTAETHPLWAAGLRGQGQVIGNGDSGIDLNSCFFKDPDVELKLKQNIYTQIKWYEDSRHRKVRFYRLYADSSGAFSSGLPNVLDRNGHGTHVAGTLVGESLGRLSEFNGVAPKAKVAFHDLGKTDAARGIQTPFDLQMGYFRWSYLYGARVHSDSWGSEDSSYDSLAWDVDAFSWNNPDFLAVFAAGNDGTNGVSTVLAPATSKNALAVGATLSVASPELPTPRVKRLGSVYKAVISGGLAGGWMNGDQFNVLQSSVGGALASVAGGSRKYRLVAADPLDACSDLVNSQSVSGKVVVVERGSCYDVSKIQAAQRAGAAGVLIANNEVNEYFTLEAPPAGSPGGSGSGSGPSSDTIPAAAIPKSVGRIILLSLTLRRPLEVSFEPAAGAPNTYDNVADYSSFGPTQDGRTKPDVVAPGTVVSAAKGQSCGVAVFSGTSMSCPVVAGGALLVRQYFTEGFYPSGAPVASSAFEPSGALVKAVIIGGATPLEGFTETGLPLAPAPSRRQGYGRVTLAQSLQLKGSTQGWRMQVIDGAKLATGESHQYCIRATGGPLRVTLVWHDLPSNIAAARNLVNDLDLSVRAAGLQGLELRGNGEEDRLNNVEQVALDEVSAGQVAIEVRAHSVFAKYGPQPYALVVQGVFNGILESPHNPGSKATSASGSCVVLVAAVTIGPDMVTKIRDPEFSFNTRTGSEPAAGYECRLVAQDEAENEDSSWSPCESPTRYTGLADGSYTFSVRAAGEEVADSHPFLVDTTPPAVSFQSRPAIISSSQTADIQFGVRDATSVRLECRLERLSSPSAAEDNTDDALQVVESSQLGGAVELGSWAPCSSPQQLSHIAVGEWRFSVRGTDAAGNQAEPTSAEWLVELDKNKVYTRLLAGPAGPSNGGVVRFEFQAVRALSEGEVFREEIPAFACRLERRSDDTKWVPAGQDISQGWEPCGSPFQRNDLPDGLYRFSVSTEASANDGTADAGETRAVSLFSVDTRLPEVEIVISPSPLQAGRTAKFAFKSNEPGIAYSCALLSGEEPVAGRSWSECSSPKVYTGLPDGVYTFYLTGSDEVGNKAVTKKKVFQVDGSKPSIRSVTLPPPSNSTAAEVVFVVDDGTDGSGVDNVQCRLAAVCVGPADCDEQRVVAELPDGTSIGNDWRSCGDRVCRRCDDGTAATTGQYVPCLRCTVPYELSEGLFHFSVLAFDHTLNSNDPANYTLVVDSLPPQAAVRSGPSQVDRVASSVRFTFDLLDGGPGGSGVAETLCLLQPEDASPDEIAGKEPSFGGVGTRTSTGTGKGVSTGADTLELLETVMVRGEGERPMGRWEPCREPIIFDGLPQGRYGFRLQPIDAAGNVGPVSDPYVFEVDPALPIPEFAAAEGEDGGVGDGGTATFEALPVDGGPPLMRADTMTIVGASLVSLAAAVTIIFAIWWLRRREHRRREAERDAEEAAAAEAPAYLEMGPVIRGEDHRSVANRAAAEEDERLRQAIQASLEEAQLAEVMQASLESERDERARLESLRMAEQELVYRGIEASVDESLSQGNQGFP